MSDDLEEKRDDDVFYAGGGRGARRRRARTARMLTMAPVLAVVSVSQVGAEHVPARGAAQQRREERRPGGPASVLAARALSAPPRVRVSERLMRYYRPLAEVLIGTGVRISEALALTWPDVGLRTGTIRVQRQRDRHRAPAPYSAL